MCSRFFSAVVLVALIFATACNNAKSEKSVIPSSAPAEFAELWSAFTLAGNKGKLLTYVDKKAQNHIVFGSFPYKDGVIEITYVEEVVDGGEVSPPIQKLCYKSKQGDIYWAMLDYGRDGVLDYGCDYPQGHRISTTTMLFDAANKIGMDNKRYWQERFDKLVPELTTELNEIRKKA